ncbi:hypothetical protein [Comamonas terrigena]|uniref:hypothetical protein n=1 Tax=Comamonas terrigena TaxID=32013 RepID=UPI0028A2CFF6|nr:hypothetical protein [Comamonas terrigena]
MGYSRHRGFSGQRTYEPVFWVDEQEELRLIHQQEAKRAAAAAAAATTKAPAAPPPPAADLPDPQART